MDDSDGNRVSFVEFSSMEPKVTGDCVEGPTSARDGILTLTGMSHHVIKRDCVGGFVAHTWGDPDS